MGEGGAFELLEYKSKRILKRTCEEGQLSVKQQAV